MHCVHLLCGFRLGDSVIRDILIYGIGDLLMFLYFCKFYFYFYYSSSPGFNLFLGQKQIVFSWTARKKNRAGPLRLASAMQGWLICDVGVVLDSSWNSFKTMVLVALSLLLCQEILRCTSLFLLESFVMLCWPEDVAENIDLVKFTVQNELSPSWSPI